MRTWYTIEEEAYYDSTTDQYLAIKVEVDYEEGLPPILAQRPEDSDIGSPDEIQEIRCHILNMPHVCLDLKQTMPPAHTQHDVKTLEQWVVKEFYDRAEG